MARICMSKANMLLKKHMMEKFTGFYEKNQYIPQFFPTAASQSWCTTYQLNHLSQLPKQLNQLLNQLKQQLNQIKKQFKKTLQC